MAERDYMNQSPGHGGAAKSPECHDVDQSAGHGDVGQFPGQSGYDQSNYNVKRSHGGVHHFNGNVTADYSFQGVNFGEKSTATFTTHKGTVRRRSTHARIAHQVLEVFEFLFSIFLVGITGSASQGMTDDLGFSRIPPKLGYNIFVAVLSMLLTPILFLLGYFRPPWLYGTEKVKEPWWRICASALLTVLWIGTIPASFYTCGDLCYAAGPGDWDITFVTLYCECYNSGAPNPGHLGGNEQPTGRYQATEGLDTLQTIFFLFSTALLLASRHPKLSRPLGSDAL
ncbi:hypothetical protein F5Y16DRAFT_389503 [Xylariaceae sp. FL0255]|nr:hypothetical protein F5Y16DRAFT_389503 [Xylariaceae sp. FL0255]